MNIRKIKPEDKASWSTLRTALWPDTADAHLAEIEAFFSGTATDVVAVFVAELNAEVVGFIELNIRNFAEGSRQPQVPYVEGWYIQPEQQSQGIGKALMQQAERWAVAQGFTELASDTEIDNHHSMAVHKHLGFVETERVVCFLKPLKKGVYSSSE